MQSRPHLHNKRTDGSDGGERLMINAIRDIVFKYGQGRVVGKTSKVFGWVEVRPEILVRKLTTLPDFTSACSIL